MRNSSRALSSLTEKGKTALLGGPRRDRIAGNADRLELHDRMTDENADRLYVEIDALYEKLDSVLRPERRSPGPC